MKPKCVLVAGAYGVIGRRTALHFAAQPDTTVIGLSRRTGPHLEGVRLIPIDLLQPHDVRSKLGSLNEVTHIVFGAYIEKPTAREKSQVNVAILRNLLDVVEATSSGLEHVTFYQGGKAYGAEAHHRLRSKGCEVPLRALLPRTQKVLLIVIKVGRHQSRIVFPCWCLVQKKDHQLFCMQLGFVNSSFVY